MVEPASRERVVTFTSAGLTLTGSFTTPARPGKAPAVLLVPGSGHSDRDGNIKRLAINPFPPMVRALDALSVATLRYDKRGVGASQGGYWQTGFDDRLTDALAAVDWLRSQPEVDPTQIFALGHSEGALVAVRLAAGAAPVAGLILLAGAAKTGEQTLRWQGQKITAALTGLPRLVIRVLHLDPLRMQDKQIKRIKASTTDTLRVHLVQKVNAKWLREFLAYDPAPDLANIHVPVLAISGDKDLQVDSADLDRMAALIPAPFEAHRLPDLTHLLRSEPGAPSLQTYKRQVRAPIDPEVIRLIGTWVTQRVHPAAPDR